MSARVYKVTLVDDSALIRKMLASYMPPAEFEISHASNGEEALQVVKRVNPDLIVLDMNMPGMGGIEVLKHLTLPNGKLQFRVLVLTARSTMSGFFDSLDVAGFLAKPCEQAVFMEKVRSILGASAGASAGAKEPDAKRSAIRRILVGEGDEKATAALDKALKAAGYETAFVANGPATVEKAAVFHPEIILLRITLPGLNGDAVAQMLHAMPSTASVPIIVYEDGLSSEDVARLERKIGQNARKVVPTSAPETLLQVIKRF